MSIEEIIIDFLSSSLFRYKGSNLMELFVPLDTFEKRKYYTSLSRLKKKGYIIKNGSSWKILPDGRTYIKKRKLKLRSFTSTFPAGSSKNLLLMFDVPESKNKHRVWLRMHLRQFGYMMIQKSVWVGPSPLPNDFVEYIKVIGLLENIKMFKLAKGYRDATLK